MQKSKIIGSIILSLFLAVGLAGCGNTANDNAGNEADNQVTEDATSESASEEEASGETTENVAEDADGTAESMGESPGNTGNTLVVYFSREGEQYGVGMIDKGNTEIVAEMVADATGAELYEIVPEEDNYPTTYDELTDVAKQEQNEGARPAYQDTVPDLSEYDTVFIGAPVWWGDWPMVMYTFFEENGDALEGKTLIPFSTHAGSGLSGFDSKLASVCPDSDVETGLAIAGTDAQDNQEKVRQSVSDWVSGLGY